MSAPFWALLAAVAGALLAGGASLLLEWRRDTLEARVGTLVAIDILAAAERGLRALTGVPAEDDCSDATPPPDNASEPGDPRWWPPGALPVSDPWWPHRAAVEARLPRDVVAQTVAALGRLDSLNRSARRAADRADQLDARIWDAVANDGRGLEELRTFQMAHDPRRLSGTDLGELRKAAHEFCVTRRELTRNSPLREAYGQSSARDPLPKSIAWARWHWRPLVMLAMVVAAVATAVVLGNQKSDTEKVEEAIARHVTGEAMTACEPIADHEGRFSCWVVKRANGAVCSSVGASPSSRHLVASRTPLLTQGRGGCNRGDTTVTEILEFTAAMDAQHRCTEAVLSDAAALPPKEAAKPGLLRRLFARKNGSEGTLPDQLVPKTAFVRC